VPFLFFPAQYCLQDTKTIDRSCLSLTLIYPLPFLGTL
jgi:hypothetical protein